MRRLTAGLLAAVLLCVLAVPARAAGIPTETGTYGSYFYIVTDQETTPLEPQSYLYEMLYKAIAGKNPAEIHLTWEATPLHGGTYMRDEAMTALNLDHPELNLGMYEITNWEAHLAGAYNAKFTFDLRRRAEQTAAYTDAVTAAQERVNAAGDSNYAKAKAAFDWLMKNAEYVWGNSTAEAVFAHRKGDAAGFSAAFKLLMDGAGVPCVLGFNGLSTWAYVEIETDKYYVVDFKRAASGGSRWFLCEIGRAHV